MARGWISPELQASMADMMKSEIMSRMPISDEEACAWLSIYVRLERGYTLHCSDCDFEIKYRRGEVWKLAEHSLTEHGMKVTLVTP